MMFTVKRPDSLPSFKRTSSRHRADMLSNLFTATFLSHGIAPTLFAPVNVAPPRKTPDVLKREASDEQALDDENPVGRRAVSVTPGLHIAFKAWSAAISSASIPHSRSPLGLPSVQPPLSPLSANSDHGDSSSDAIPPLEPMPRVPAPAVHGTALVRI